MMYFNKEKIVRSLKEFFQYLCLGAAVTVGYLIGNYSYEFRHPKQQKQNPYSIIYAPKDISIAINESDGLLIFMKKSGDYVVYSDSIGQIIFKMYANRIYQEHAPEKEIK